MFNDKRMPTKENLNNLYKSIFIPILNENGNDYHLL